MPATLPKGLTVKLIDRDNANDVGKIKLPEANRHDIIDLFVDLGYRRGVEIGVYKADYTQQMAAAGLEITGIDPYMAYGGYHDQKHYPDRRRFQDRQDFLYGHALRALEPYPNARIIRKTSMDALHDFEDGSLDFVYIDGHHGFGYVAQDIWFWTTKIRPGGILAGHDYFRYKQRRGPRDAYALHVSQVVDSYTAAMPIKTWYVIGRLDYRHHDYPSWFWFIM
jgi:hypothetical protein